MIDLHCHLLPGIDDGASDMAQALEMARLAVEDGITHAVLTPHIQPGRWDNSKAQIAAAVEQFRQELAAVQIPLALSFAAEVRITDEILQLLERDQLPFLGRLEGYNLLLVEFPPNFVVPNSDKLFKWLMAQQIRPLIAHPERNRELANAPQKLKAFLDQGCLAQLTAASLLGRFGKVVAVAAELFIREDMVHVVASDAHNISTRSPQMTAARERVASLVDEAMAERLFNTTPRKILTGE